MGGPRLFWLVLQLAAVAGGIAAGISLFRVITT
jgi:hypothetical protein